MKGQRKVHHTHGDRVKAALWIELYSSPNPDADPQTPR